MADEAKSTYYGQGNRGKAAILDNAWKTPLELLAGQQKQYAAQEQQKQLQQQEIEAKERAIRDKQMNDALMANPDGAMFNHIPEIENRVQALHKKVADMGGRPRNGAEYREIMAEANLINGVIAQSKEQNKLLQSLDKDAADHSDKLDLNLWNDSKYGLLQTKTPDEIAADNLKLNRYYDQEKTAAEAIKGLGLESTKGARVYYKNGRPYTEEVEEYSPEQIASAKNSLLASQNYVDATKSKYDKEFKAVPAEQRKPFEQYLNEEATKRAEAIQFKKKDLTVGGEGRESWEDWKRKKDYENGSKEDKALKRAEFIAEAMGGDKGKLDAFKGAKTAKGEIVDITIDGDVQTNSAIGQVDNDKRIPFQGGLRVKSPVVNFKILTGRSNNPVTGKEEAHYETVSIDTSKDGWQHKFSNTLNTVDGDNVSPEAFDEAVKKLKANGKWLTAPNEQSQPSPTPAKKSTGLSFPKTTQKKTTTASSGSKTTGGKPTGITFKTK